MQQTGKTVALFANDVINRSILAVRWNCRKVTVTQIVCTF